MSQIEVKFPKGVRRGESCSLFVRIPETKTTKQVSIAVSRGVSLPDGNVFRIAPKVKYAHIPVTFSKTSPDRVRVKINVKAKSGENYELIENFMIRK